MQIKCSFYSYSRNYISINFNFPYRYLNFKDDINGAFGTLGTDVMFPYHLQLRENLLKVTVTQK